MARDAAEILREALNLPPEGRAALAGSLLESFEEECDSDAEERWREEVSRRVREIDSGAAHLIPWDEARRRLRSTGKP
jgi:putative addiction module component (TIGR02574 family)